MLGSLLFLSSLLFVVGLYGVLVKKNAVVVLFSLELMLNSVNINFIAFAQRGPIAGAQGHVFSLFSMGVAAAGAAVGLAILLALYRHTGTTDIRSFRALASRKPVRLQGGLGPVWAEEKQDSGGGGGTT